MNKLIALVAAFATTTSLYVTSAEAGCGGSAYHRSSYRAAAHISKPRNQSVAAARQDAKDDGKAVAEAPVAAKTETVALNTAPVTENSSIVTGTAKIADAKPVPAKAEAKAVEKVATATTGAKDCKQFFPTAGITLSVRCE
jgi:hypothetical protein